MKRMTPRTTSWLSHRTRLVSVDSRTAQLESLTKTASFLFTARTSTNLVFVSSKIFSNFAVPRSVDAET